MGNWGVIMSNLLNFLARAVKSSYQKMEQRTMEMIDSGLSPLGERFKSIYDTYNLVYKNAVKEYDNALNNFEYLYPIDNSFNKNMYNSIRNTINNSVFKNELKRLVIDARKCTVNSLNDCDVFYANAVIRINDEYDALIINLKNNYLEKFNSKDLSKFSNNENELSTADKKWLNSDFSKITLDFDLEDFSKNDSGVNVPDSVKKLCNAASRNSPYAQYKLGELYFENINKSSSNIQLAIKWLEKAYENGALRSSILLFKCYALLLKKENVSSSTSQIYKKFLDWLYKSALFGDAYSEYTFAKISLESYTPIGRIRAEKKLKENYGIKWMIRAAQHGNEDAKIFLTEKKISF